MSRIKKVVAVLLTLALVFGSVSVSVSAFMNPPLIEPANMDDGTNSSIIFTQKIFREDGEGNWVETTKVAPGDEIKIRFYMQTDFYSGLFASQY